MKQIAGVLYLFRVGVTALLLFISVGLPAETPTESFTPTFSESPTETETETFTPTKSNTRILTLTETSTETPSITPLPSWTPRPTLRTEDLNGDGNVDYLDFALFSLFWRRHLRGGPDFSGNGYVDTEDLAQLQRHFDLCPQPVQTPRLVPSSMLHDESFCWLELNYNSMLEVNYRPVTEINVHPGGYVEVYLAVCNPDRLMGYRAALRCNPSEGVTLDYVNGLYADINVDGKLSLPEIVQVEWLFLILWCIISLILIPCGSMILIPLNTKFSIVGKCLTAMEAERSLY